MLYVLTVVHNRREVSARFARQLKEGSFQDFHLVVVDDGSTDGTDEALKEALPTEKLTLLRGDGSLWWAGGLQRGIDHLTQLARKDDILLLANDDISYAAEFLTEAITLFNRLPKHTIMHPRQVLSDGRITHGYRMERSGKRARILPAKEDLHIFDTRALFIRWEDMPRIGGFQPGRLPHYRSDWEFTYRAHQRGLQLHCCSEPSISVVAKKDQKPPMKPEDIRSLADVKTVFLNVKSPSHLSSDAWFHWLVFPWPEKLIYAIRPLVRFVRIWLHWRFK